MHPNRLYLYDHDTNDDPKQVIFINQQKIAELDNFFSQNLAEVTRLFNDYGLKFIYLPAMLTPQFVSTLLDYQTPWLSEEERADTASRITPHSIYDKFVNRECFDNPFASCFSFEKVDSSNPIRPKRKLVLKPEKDRPKYTGLVWATGSNPVPSLTECDKEECFAEGRCEYHFAALERIGYAKDVWDQLDDFFHYNFPNEYKNNHSDYICYNVTNFSVEDEKHSDDDVPASGYYSMSSESDLDDVEHEMLLPQSGITSICKHSKTPHRYEADETFPTEAYQLTQEVLERVEKLRRLGVNELIIKGLFDAQPTLSRLVITRDWRLFLPDYQDREIVMTPLVKAVYVLFLNHPEGIVFKEIGNWKLELLELYERVSGREADSEMRASVEAACDPLNNSINEKCSRIREAFLREIDNTIACNYYITGERATPKGIRLERNLLQFEGGVEQSHVCPF